MYYAEHLINLQSSGKLKVIIVYSSTMYYHNYLEISELGRIAYRMAVTYRRHWQTLLHMSREQQLQAFLRYCAIYILFTANHVQIGKIKKARCPWALLEAICNICGKGIAPLILNLGTRLMWVVSFTPRPLYPRNEIPGYILNRRLAVLHFRYTRFWGGVLQCLLYVPFHSLLKNLHFTPRSLFMLLVWPAIGSHNFPDKINWHLFTLEMQCVFCEEGNYFCAYFRWV